MNTSDSQSLSLLPGSSQGPHDKVLPPLTSQFPQWSRGGKLGRENCYQRPFMNGDVSPDSSLQRISRENMVNKKSPELANVGRSEGLMMTPIADPLLRVTQLEQNIRFLQEQHQLMLSSLHQEVEQLRHRNRDLQFQLVFAKGGAPIIQSSPSSPEDDTKPKIILSPKQINVTPLQIELLEKEMAELKAALHEAKTKNIYLSAIVEEQRKKLESLESGRQEVHSHNYRSKSSSQNQTTERHVDDRGDASDCDLATKLEEAEKLIRRLRRDNEEHRRELVTIKTNLSKNLGGAGGNRQLGAGGGNIGHRGGGGSGGNAHHRPHSQQSQSQRFPPLHSQSYWHHGQHSQHRTGIEFVSHRHCANGRGGGGNGGGNNSNNTVVVNGGTRLEKDSQVVGRPAPSLPNLRNNSSNHYAFSNGNGNNNGHNHRRGHYNGNSNHYYRGGKGGGGRGNREVRDTK